MQVIQSEKFRRIYLGQIMSLIGWLLTPIMIFLYIFGMLSASNTRIFSAIGSTYRIISAILTVVQVVAAVEILGGLVDLRPVSNVFRKACGWGIAFFFTQTIFAIFDTFVSVMGRNSISLFSLPGAFQVFRAAEIPLNTITTFVISFCMNAYLLKGYMELLYDYGGSESEIRKTRAQKIILVASSITLTASYMTLWSIYAIAFNTTSFVMGQIFQTNLESATLRAFCIFLNFLFITSLIIRVIIQLRIIISGRTVSRTIECIMK